MRYTSQPFLVRAHGIALRKSTTGRSANARIIELLSGAAPKYKQGPVVQRVVSLTSSLKVISLTVLADSIYNILIIFAEKM